MDEIPLGAAIAEIRRELKIALAARDDRISLGVKEIELELTLEIGKRSNGNAGVDLVFAKGGAETERSGAHRHYVKLVLEPGVLNRATGEVEDLRLAGTKPVAPYQASPDGRARPNSAA
jgi:hypothetical protein